jgi:hypothetical protein
VAYRIVDELPFGFGWELDERYARTSHALADGGRVWLVDPVDVAGLDERVATLGSPAGVVQLPDRHRRDCAAIAARLDVPLHPAPDALPGTPFEVVRIVRLPFWREVALWWPGRRTLVCADALGTSGYFTADGGRAGVHPFLRLFPPRALLAYEPEHLLVGHGDGVHEGAGAALHEAVRTARTGLPRWALGLVRGRGARAAARRR